MMPIWWSANQIMFLAAWTSLSSLMLHSGHVKTRWERGTLVFRAARRAQLSRRNPTVENDDVGRFQQLAFDPAEAGMLHGLCRAAFLPVGELFILDDDAVILPELVRKLVGCLVLSVGQAFIFPVEEKKNASMALGSLGLAAIRFPRKPLQAIRFSRRDADSVPIAGDECRLASEIYSKGLAV
jgi:hypothetical protein